ncbi:MAG: 4-hydroxy-3-methylbut-2-enyl diphosphate reductase [Spirochaetes bacterium RBG_16_49_21]|nr:MAG: 4-hydroxy-3-methylbut-2-enyl diphosphate reductase [Spirochaetes bacterium RBG_16_49_21]
MRITLAKHSGFCMGVRTAIVRIIREINSSHDDVYMYGPLIHNPQTVELLQKRGLKTIDSPASAGKKQVAVRTHGIPLEESRLLRQCAERVINLTCPRVAKVQSIIKKYSAQGYYTIITGDTDHAEVVGLKSYAQAGVSVISDIREVPSIPQAKQYLVVSQTTFDREGFDKITAELRMCCDSITVFDTICDSTSLRQNDVLAGIVSGNDTLVVVGGKNSANTKRLARIGTDNNVKTFHIETGDELTEDGFSDSRSVLVTAGTSTPGWIINNVLDKLYAIKFKKSNIFLKSALIFLQYIMRTNLLSAAAAFFMSLIALAYSGIGDGFLFPTISFLYIFSMYSINNYFEKSFLKLSNPDKYLIYEKYGIPLLTASIISMLASIYLARECNPATIAVIITSYLTGFIYSTKPARIFIEKINVGFVKKMYYSKIVTCLGWIIVTVMVPMLASSVEIQSLVSLSAWVFTVIFLRTVLLDLIAYQGDLIMGRETLPLWLGADKVWIAANIISAAGILVYGYVTIALNNLYFLPFIVTILYFLAFMYIIKNLNYIIPLKYELLVDMNFIIMALLYLYL